MNEQPQETIPDIHFVRITSRTVQQIWELSTAARKLCPSLNVFLIVCILGSEVKDAWTKTQVCHRVNNRRRTDSPPIGEFTEGTPRQGEACASSSGCP